MGKHIKKKAFKNDTEAQKHKDKLCLELGTKNIEFHRIKSTTVEKYNLIMYSFNNLDIINRQGGQKIRQPLSAMQLRYSDKEINTDKLLVKQNKFDNQIGPVILTPGIRVAYKHT